MEPHIAPLTLGTDRYWCSTGVLPTMRVRAQCNAGPMQAGRPKNPDETRECSLAKMLLKLVSGGVWPPTVACGEMQQRCLPLTAFGAVTMASSSQHPLPFAVAPSQGNNTLRYLHGIPLQLACSGGPFISNLFPRWKQRVWEMGSRALRTVQGLKRTVSVRDVRQAPHVSQHGDDSLLPQSKLREAYACKQSQYIGRD